MYTQTELLSVSKLDTDVDVVGNDLTDIGFFDAATVSIGQLTTDLNFDGFNLNNVAAATATTVNADVLQSTTLDAALDAAGVNIE